jgi:hypothetical protein
VISAALARRCWRSGTRHEGGPLDERSPGQSARSGPRLVTLEPVSEAEADCDWEQLATRLRDLRPLVDQQDEWLAQRFDEFLRVGEYALAAEVLMALGGLYPVIDAQIGSQLPEALIRDLDSEVIADYQRRAPRGA